MEKILIVEDDIYISDMLLDLLSQNGYAPTAAYSGTEALLLLLRHSTVDSFALILLDLMLPGKTGEEVLMALREHSTVPVIVLTARTDKETTVHLLESGADDYIAKPFDNKELLARINVQLRRASEQEPCGKHLRHKNLLLDPDSYDAYLDDKKACLSKREFDILHLLMSHPHKVFSKNNLYASIWGDDYLGDDNTINVHISKLRAKLSALSPDAEYIQTVWGIGFKIKE